MNQVKPWYKSKTVWGIVVAALVALAQAVGVTPAEELPGWLAHVIEIVALTVALIGRYVAKERIK